MGGLGQRGQKKAMDSASELFRKTEPAETAAASASESSKNGFTQNSKNTFTQNPAIPIRQDPVRKQYVLSWELSERLRAYCFRERRKEVDVIREALAEYFDRRGC